MRVPCTNLPVVFSFAFVSGILFRHSWAWKKASLITHRSSISRFSIPSTTEGAGGEVQTQQHRLCNPFPEDTNVKELDMIRLDWKSLAASVFANDSRPVVLFDGVCNLCNGAVNFSLDHDHKGKFRFVSLQSKIGQSLLMAAGKQYDDISSIVLVESCSSSSQVSAFFKADAVLKIAKELDYPFFSTIGTFAPLLVPGFVRNKVYDVVAKNRYRFGEVDGADSYSSCRLDKYEEFEDRFISDPTEEKKVHAP
jgi:predicted DCC family thiol-disulfide oxidoreductase YuxK